MDVVIATSTTNEAFISGDDEISLPDDACPTSPCYSPTPSGGLALDVIKECHGLDAYMASWVSKEPQEDQIEILYCSSKYWQSLAKDRAKEIEALKIKISNLQTERAFGSHDEMELARMRRQHKVLIKGLDRLGEKLEMFECLDDLALREHSFEVGFESFFDELLVELSHWLDEYGIVESERELYKSRASFAATERDDLRRRLNASVGDLEKIELALKCANLELAMLKDTNDDLIADVSEKTKALDALISSNADLQAEMRAIARQIPDEDVHKALKDVREENKEIREENVVLIDQMESFKSRVEYLSDEVKRLKECDKPKMSLRPVLDKELKKQFDCLHQSASDFRVKMFSDQLSQIGANFKIGGNVAVRDERS